jgi:hypothetical protein
MSGLRDSPPAVAHQNREDSSVELIRTWVRVHTNGVAATVNQYRVASAEFVYSAGACRMGSTRPLRMNIVRLDTAHAYAEAEACKDGHDCAEGCGLWVSIPEHPRPAEGW